MALAFGERPEGGVLVDGRELHAGVFNENEVRAAAGITLVIAAGVFSVAQLRHIFVPLQVASSFFFAEFLIRTTVGLKYSPVGVLSRWMTFNQPPEWVSAKPKRFAWSLGLVLAGAMTVITNSGIRGWLPKSFCIVCMTMMWLESALGLCLGCQLYAWLVRRGWRQADAEIEVCAGGVCSIPANHPMRALAHDEHTSQQPALSISPDAADVQPVAHDAPV